MRLVDIESPYAGNVSQHVDYARQCVVDCLARGEAPIASHLLFTQDGILRDWIPAERELGIAAGKAWAERADATVVYVDFGISPGMQRGIDMAIAAGRVIEYRSIL